MVEARNTKGETPLFVATHHGKKRAFFALQDAIPKELEEEVVSYLRRSDGNARLHSAIIMEYFVSLLFFRFSSYTW